jgi:two-component system OmpR family response regulator
LPKPCSAREILANVRTVLRERRRFEAARTIVNFRDWKVDLEANEVFDPEGVLVPLTDGEFAMLRVFIERPRRVLSRDELLLAARGRDSDSFDRAVDIQISRLRRKLRAPGDSVFRTVRNEGYMLSSKVTISTAR